MNQPNHQASIIGTIATTALIGLPVWFLGGNMPPVRTLALVTVGLSGILLCAAGIFRSQCVRQLPLALWAAIPLCLGVAYAAMQAWPAETNPLASSYPAATRLRLCELILGVSAYLFFSRLLIRPAQISRFFGIVMITGAAVAAFGLVQHAGWNGKLYWFYELIYGGQPFGPFVNGNNAGGFLLMCFAAGNFFLASRVYRGAGKRSADVTFKSPGLGREIKDFLVGMLAQLDTPRLYVCGAMVLMAGGIATSLSRGALVALAVATLTGWMVLFSNKRLVILFSGLLLAAGIAIALYAEGSSSDLRTTTVSESLNSMTDVAEASSNRLDHWSVALRVVQDHWATGTGLGTYAISYPPYQESHLTRIFVHAENQYLEALVELGVFGLAILLTVISVFMAYSLQLVREADAFSRAVGVSGLMCLVSQMIAGGLDFGLYQPANTILMASMMGAVVGRRTWIDQTRPLNPVVAPAWGRLLNQIVFASMIMATCWAAYEYSAVDARVTAARFVARFQPLRDSTRIDNMERLSEYALSVRPDDAANHLALADLKTLRYRIDASYQLVEAAEEALEMEAADVAEPTDDAAERAAILSAMQIMRTARLGQEPVDQPSVDTPSPSSDRISKPSAVVATTEETGSPASPVGTIAEPKVTLEDVWASTQISSLHRLSRASQKFNPELHADLANAAPVKNHLSAALVHLRQAHKFLPSDTHVVMLIAQLAHLFDDDSEQQLINTAIEGQPYDSAALFTGGLLSLQSFRYNEGCDYWNRCLKLTRTYDPQIIAFCRSELTVDQFLNQILPEDPELLVRLARSYFRAPEDYVLKKIILDHTMKVVAKSKLPDSEKLKWRGIAAFESRRYQDAISQFNQVLENQSDLVSIRILLARSLIAEKQYLEAIKELKVCQLYADSPIALVQRLLNVANRNQNNFLRELRRQKK